MRVPAERFVRGLLPSLDPGDGSRLPAKQAAKLPVDTVAAARVPAGVHLAFTGDATAVTLSIEQFGATSVPAPTLGTSFDVWVGPEFHGAVKITDDQREVEIALPDRDPATPVRVYYPEPVRVRIDAITVAHGTIRPTAGRPLLVVYGDSIAQGWSVSAAGRCWPSLVGEELGFDVVNLGFAGCARGEPFVADVVGESSADAVVIAWGTNCWTSYPTSTPLIEATMRQFLTTVRQGLPETPVVVLTPVLRPDAETTPNRFGASLADLRTAQERAVREFIADTGDRRMVLRSGAGILTERDLADGVHPDDAGHARVAAAVRDAMRAASAASAG